jgi:hypothetical protein
MHNPSTRIDTIEMQMWEMGIYFTVGTLFSKLNLKL